MRDLELKGGAFIAGYVASLGLAVWGGSALADKIAPPIPPVFVPFSVNYIGGALVNVTPLKNEEDKLFVFWDLHECREKLQGATEHALMDQPEGHGVVGMCVPMASVDPTMRAGREVQ